MLATPQGLVIALLLAPLFAFVMYWPTAGMDKPFNRRLAMISGMVAAAVVALAFFIWNLLVAAWRLHEEQAERIREFERHADVGRLITLRARAVQLLNRPVESGAELIALKAALRTWEGDTAAELKMCAKPSDVAAFETPGPLTPMSFGGVFNTEHTAEKTMLSVRLERLAATIRRIEGGTG